VWPSGEAGAPNLSNNIALIDMLPTARQDFGHVQILCRISAVVFYLDEVSVSCRKPRLFNHARSRCHNGSSGGCGVISAFVGFPDQLYRMEPVLGEMRGNVDILEWRFEEEIFERFPFVIEIIELSGTFILFERKRIDGFPFVFEKCGFETVDTIINRVVNEAFGKSDAEFIAFFEFEEVD
jgi:hypothetical protein